MKKQILLIIAALAGGILLGRILFHSSPAGEVKQKLATDNTKVSIWTCAMHPQIRMHEPGKCPICAMDLIPLVQSGQSVDPGAIHMTKEAAQLANVLTSVVSRQNPVKELRLYGKIQADERLIQSQVSYFPGRIEKLFVNFTGEEVRKGQTLALVYSPDLVTAQQELIETAATKASQPALYEASKEKLRQWKLTDSQITAIENTGTVRDKMEIASTAGGIVTARLVNNGDYVNQGTVLYQVSDLSKVWVLFDAYESDLPFLNKGDKIDFTIQALPGSSVTGTIDFIDPVIDPVTRVAKIRVEVNNSSGKLKPEMFATGIVKSRLEQFKNMLVIPRSSVLWTGKRSLVYVKQKGVDPVFKIREIGLGPLMGNSFVVTDGLTEGEEIVTEGAFSVDATAQLEGKPSMMNREMNNSGTSGPDNNLHDIAFKVSGNCEMCKERIEKVTRSIAGVVSANWNAVNKMLEVTFRDNKTDKGTIEQAIADAGHDTELFKASDLAYNKLPECCRYDRSK